MFASLTTPENAFCLFMDTTLVLDSCSPGNQCVRFGGDQSQMGFNGREVDRVRGRGWGSKWITNKTTTRLNSAQWITNDKLIDFDWLLKLDENEWPGPQPHTDPLNTSSSSVGISKWQAQTVLKIPNDHFRSFHTNSSFLHDWLPMLVKYLWNIVVVMLVGTSSGVRTGEQKN